MFDFAVNKAILKALFPKTFTPPSRGPGYFHLLQGTISNEFVKKATGELLATAVVTKGILAETYQWFEANPPAANGSNFELRRTHSAILDQLGFEAPVMDMNWYSWTDKPKFTLAENQSPILYY